MQPSKAAWCMREFLAGKPQTQIAREIGYVQISSILMKFYAQFGWWSTEFSWQLDYNKRRNLYFRQALDNYIFAGHEIVPPALRAAARPAAPKPDRVTNEYPVWYGTGADTDARHEHAWLLRAEGLTYRQVGERLGGISVERTRQIVHKQGRRVARALQHTIFEIEYPEDREAEYFELW